MKILFVSALLPYPLLSGGQIRIYNLLKSLSGRHSITLVSFIRSEAEHELVKQLNFLEHVEMFYRGKRLQVKYISRFIRGSSLLLASYNNQSVKQYLASALSDHKYQLIHIEPFYVALSIPETSVPLIAAEHNIENEVYLRFAQTAKWPLLKPWLYAEAARIKSEEIRILKKSNHIVSVSSIDRDVIRKIAPGIPVSVIPNGVDTDYFRFHKHRASSDRPVFLFTGNMNWVPNLEAVNRLTHDIWPEIKTRIPKATLLIVGANAKAATANRNGISYSDRVTDIRSAYNSADALLAPFQIAGGSKFKILESMASGLPVLTTSEGIAGLGVKNNIQIKLAQTTGDFVRLALELTSEGSGWPEITQNARHYIEKFYDWTIISKQLENVWESFL